MNASKRQSGFTLIELMIVVSLLGMLSALGVMSLGNVMDSNFRATASKLAGSIRFTYDLAARKSETFRVVLDLDEKAYWVESAGSHALLDRGKARVMSGKSSEDEPKESRFVTRSFIESGDMWKPKARPSYTATSGPFTQKVTLPEEISFQGVWVAHQSDRVTSGKAYLYCFPTGLTERAVIHLTNEDKEIYTVWVEPLTGKVTVYPYYVEVPED